MPIILRYLEVVFIRLGDAHGRGLITDNELAEYISKGYEMNDQIVLQTSRPGFMLFVSYNSMDADHHWTIDSGETQVGFIGSLQDMTNAGAITNNGELMLLHTTGKIVNSGVITNTGLITLKELT